MTSPLRSLFLTKFSLDPVEQQRRLGEAFLKIVPQTRLVIWQTGDLIPLGVFLLVGVMVSWNRYDQELVAALDEAVADGRAGSDLVAVISADYLTTAEEVEAVFPGLRIAHQSPYVGLRENGLLRLVDAGSSAMAFLSDRYGLAL
jgi:hypothetical protein